MGRKTCSAALVVAAVAASCGDGYADVADELCSRGARCAMGDARYSEFWPPDRSGAGWTVVETELCRSALRRESDPEPDAACGRALDTATCECTIAEFGECVDAALVVPQECTAVYQRLRET
jgi:hypothetical protein